jgi:MFS family permease
LVPEAIRGQYLARDQISSALAFLGSMIVSAVYLSGHTSDARFAGIFSASFVAAIVSLWYLRRVPDVPVAEHAAGTGTVPWKEMLLYRPFLKLMIYNFTLCSAFAAAGVFWVPFLRDYHKVTDGQMLGVVALGNGAAVVTLLGFGSIIDRVGSRPLLALAGLAYMVHFACWGALAGNLLPFNIWTILLIQVIGGLGGSLFNLANTRLAMATIPAAGRSHFFALFSVIQNLTLGIVPILWGVLLDSLRQWQATWGPWQWNQYSVMYLVLTLTVGVGQYLHHLLTEPRAMTTEMFFRELLVETPSRAVSRLRSRLPYSISMFAIGSPVTRRGPATERPKLAEDGAKHVRFDRDDRPH